MGCTASAQRYNSNPTGIIPLTEQKSPERSWAVADHHQSSLGPSPTPVSPVKSAESASPSSPPGQPCAPARMDSVDPLRNAIASMGGWGEEALESPRQHKVKHTI